MSLAEARAAQAYLNPGHGTNVADAGPLPDGSTGTTFLVKNYKMVTVTGGGATPLVFVNLPFMETPFAYHDGTVLRGVQMPAMQPGGADAASYLSGIHAYKYRCIGKSATIVNTTARINVAGSCTVGRKTSDIDYDTRQYAIGVAADNVNIPVVQRLPVTVESVSALQNGASWDAAEGAYLISHHSNNDWVIREDVPHKCFPHPAATGGGNCMIRWTDAVGGNVANVMTEVGGANVSHAGPCDGTDIPIAIFSGIQAGSTFTVRYAVVYEVVLKASSGMIPYTVPRPLFNPAFMDLLHKYESMLDKSGLYPASYNSWNELWEGFKNFWRHGGSVAIRVLGDAISPGAGSIASSVGDFATNF